MLKTCLFIRSKNFYSLQRDLKNVTRCCASSSIKTNGVPKNETKEKFEPIYSFPYIKHFSLLNRLKVYQTLGTCLGVVVVAPLEIMSIVPSSTTTILVYIGVTGILVLSLFNLITKDIIGFIYINQDGTKLKIAKVDYWGRRKDIIVETEKWIPLSELPTKTMDFMYLQPFLEEDKKTMKLFIKFGRIHNRKMMGIYVE